MLNYEFPCVFLTQHNVSFVRKLDFELERCKVKISQNMVPWSILRFHLFWNLILSKLHEGFDVKTVFSQENGLTYF